MSTVKDLKVNTLTVLNSFNLPYYSTQLPTSAETGSLAYLASQSAVYYWNGSQWVQLTTASTDSWHYVPDLVLSTLCPNPASPGAISPSNFVAPLPASSTEGVGKRVMFDYTKAAFRAGATGASPVWDDAVRGFFSAAFGSSNTASGQSSFACGQGHTVSGAFSVAGGYTNNISGQYSTAFGRQHTISNDYSTAIGFNNNISGQLALASGQDHNIGGTFVAAFGRQHSIAGSYSTAVGYLNNIVGSFSLASGQSNSVPGSNSLASGRSNTVSGDYSLASGQSNSVSGNYSSASGLNNNVSGTRSFATGEINGVTGGYSFASGFQNSIGGDVSGAIGYVLSVPSRGSFACGSNNTVGGDQSLAAGQNNTINPGAGYSVALGQTATVAHPNVFMFSDGNALSSVAAGEFVVGASGGTRIYSNAAHSAGVVLPAGTSAWAAVSDINRKENLVELDGQDILSKVEQLPIYEYNYKETPADIKYRGPVAQDWHRLFPSGKPDLVIDTVDLDGITLAALKGLAAKVRAQSQYIKTMEKDFEARIKALEAKITQ